jgi:hypothetical protein
LTNASLDEFVATLKAASEHDLSVDVTLNNKLTLCREGTLTVSYAPFEYVQSKARLVIVGITPGTQQARNALIEARRQLLAGSNVQTAIKAAKSFASFSGPMRSNLVSMLDCIGANKWLGVSTTRVVWEAPSDDLVHFTSALRYPVFLAGKNYAGTPSMTATAILRQFLANCLATEARLLSKALWVPLGPKASEATSWLVHEGYLKEVPERGKR